MEKEVLIFGKENCPYTTKAREVFGEREDVTVRYLDVQKNPDLMEQMLHHSGGSRCVPVIVEGEEVTIGWGGT